MLLFTIMIMYTNKFLLYFVVFLFSSLARLTCRRRQLEWTAKYDWLNTILDFYIVDKSLLFAVLFLSFSFVFYFELEAAISLLFIFVCAVVCIWIAWCEFIAKQFIEYTICQKRRVRICMQFLFENSLQFKLSSMKFVCFVFFFILLRGSSYGCDSLLAQMAWKYQILKLKENKLDQES